MSIEPVKGHTFEELLLLEDDKMIEVVKEDPADISMTNFVAATLMTVSKSVHPIDLEIKKFDNKILIDKTQSNIVGQNMEKALSETTELFYIVQNASEAKGKTFDQPNLLLNLVYQGKILPPQKNDETPADSEQRNMV